MNFKFVSLSLQLVGLLPLVAYPATLVANAMQAAALMDASQRATTARGQRALMSSFVAGTTVYPLVLLVCCVLARRAPDNGTRELAWSAAPLLFLGALAALFAAIGRAQNSE